MENLFFVIAGLASAALFIILLAAVSRSNSHIETLRDAVRKLDDEIDVMWAAVARMEDHEQDVTTALSNVIVDVNALKPAPKPARKPAVRKTIAKKEAK